jgi:hypothetical protein
MYSLLSILAKSRLGFAKATFVFLPPRRDPMTTKWVADAISNAKSNEDQKQRREAENAKKAELIRGGLKRLKDEIRNAIRDFNKGVGKELVLFTSDERHSAFSVQGSARRYPRIGILVRFNEEARVLSTLPVDRSLGQTHADREKPFVQAYEVSISADKIAFRELKKPETEGGTKGEPKAEAKGETILSDEEVMKRILTPVFSEVSDGGAS